MGKTIKITHGCKHATLAALFDYNIANLVNYVQAGCYMDGKKLQSIELFVDMTTEPPTIDYKATCTKEGV